MAASVLLWLVAINAWTFLRFGHDKARAVAGLRRLRETDLLCLALIGGTLGAYAGRRYFRHKTRKQPFSTWLHLIGVAQAGAVAGFMLAGA